MKIPSTIRSLFDRFPLKTYENEAEPLSFVSEAYYFGRKSKAECLNEQITLGVHNVRWITLGSGKLFCMPTDPSGLIAALALCRKHNLSLPGQTTSDGSAYRLMPMSYMASSNNELPMLLISNGESSAYSNDDLRVELLDPNSNIAFTSLETVLSEFLDSLGDLWMMLAMGPNLRTTPEGFGDLFHNDPRFEKFTLTHKILDSKRSSDMRSWSSFAARHPNLLTNSSQIIDIAHPMMFGEHQIEEAFYETCKHKFDELEKSIPMLLSFLSIGNNSDARDILEIKFVSFVISLNHVLNNRTRTLLTRGENFNEALVYSERFLNEF
ncbi:hypothetical protein OXX59_004191 [Metschnikowia pulcherrima]